MTGAEASEGMVHLFTELCLLDASRLPIDQLMPVLGKARCRDDGEGRDGDGDGDSFTMAMVYYYLLWVYYGFTMGLLWFTMGLLWVYYDFIKMIIG